MPRGSPATQLTPGQVEVLTLLARGYREHEIAGELGVTIGIVKSRIRYAKKFLKARTPTQAVVLAISKRML